MKLLAVFIFLLSLLTTFVSTTPLPAEELRDADTPIEDSQIKVVTARNENAMMELYEGPNFTGPYNIYWRREASGECHSETSVGVTSIKLYPRPGDNCAVYPEKNCMGKRLTVAKSISDLSKARASGSWNNKIWSFSCNHS